MVAAEAGEAKAIRHKAFARWQGRKKSSYSIPEKDLAIVHVSSGAVTKSVAEYTINERCNKAGVGGAVESDGSIRQWSCHKVDFDRKWQLI